MSTVDVIVPCYRYGHYLKECVESVLAQSGPAVHVLIIDDASPDNTAEVAAELAKGDSRVTLLRHFTNRGHIATYNEGIDWASADYLLLLSADDYLLPGALNRAVSLMERHPRVGFTFGIAAEMDEQGARGRTRGIQCQNGERVLDGRDFILLSGARNIVPTPTAVVRTELQKRVGGYRAELPHSGDMEMWLRLAAHALVGFIETPQAVYRRHANNMSLLYTAQNWLLDLEQRKSTFDHFLRTCGQRFPELGRLRHTLLYLLSLDAVGHASTAFNDGNIETSRQLAAFAVHTSPTVTRSLSWTKLALKRRMGLRAWRVSQAVANGMRLRSHVRSQ
jgi:glycosyltransferase involved in cell wall biosynthesis